MASLVIFDFDDTIVSLHIDWKAVKAEVAALAQKEGITMDFSGHLVPMGNRLSFFPKMKEGIDAIYLRHETECAQKNSYTPFPGMVSLIRELKSSGKKLAIASGNHSDSIRMILMQIGLAEAFDFICGRDLVVKNKPNPDQPERILREMGVGKEDAVFVGDSPYDEGASRAAGIAHINIRPNNAKDIAALRKALLD